MPYYFKTQIDPPLEHPGRCELCGEWEDIGCDCEEKMLTGLAITCEMCGDDAWYQSRTKVSPRSMAVADGWRDVGEKKHREEWLCPTCYPRRAENEQNK